MPLISVKEGAFLYESGVNPYTGDVYHENPIILIFSNALIKHIPQLIPYIFIASDLLCGILLFKMAKNFVKKMVRISFMRKNKINDPLHFSMKTNNRI